MAGSGNITLTGDFTGNNNFKVEIAGSGNINIDDGDAFNFSASKFGSGNINACGFTAENAEVEIAGSGDTKLFATDKLNVDIS